MTKFEFNEKYEQFHDARKMSNIFVAIFFAAIILGIGSLVKFDPKPIWSAIIFGVTWIVALPSLLLFFNFGWEYEFIRRRLLKELKENKTLRQELEAEYS